MSAQAQYEQGVLYGRISVYVVLIIIISFVVALIIIKYNKNNKIQDKNKDFYPEKPDQLWECPDCNEQNPNTVFICKSCGYKIQ